MGKEGKGTRYRPPHLSAVSQIRTVCSRDYYCNGGKFVGRQFAISA